MPSLALVTGGAGFIGSHTVVRLLEDGHTVLCLDNFDPYYEPARKRANIAGLTGCERFHLLEGDIRDADFLERVFREFPITHVAHLAAQAGVRASLEDPFIYLDVNVRGTLQLLEMVRQHPVTNFLYASSSSVYGNCPRTPFREDDPDLVPISPYGVSKRQAELACAAHSHLYQIPITCLRFFTVYGPRQRPDMAIHRFVRKILRGEEIALFGDGRSYRDYTYVDDIVEGTVRALFAPAPFEIYNIGGGQAIDLRTLIGTIERVTDRTAAIRSLPAQPGDVNRTCADIQKAEGTLAYRPRTHVEAGIRKFVTWYHGAETKD